MPLTLEQEARVCAAARAYVGVPWRGQGRDKNGIDCVGIAVMSYRDAGFDIDEGQVDYRGIDSQRLVATLLRYFDKINSPTLARPGDLVLYGLPRDAHLAILVPGKYGLNGIHSHMGHRRVVEARFDLKRGLIKGVYRFKGGG